MKTLGTIIAILILAGGIDDCPAASVELSFSINEIEVIRDYYRSHSLPSQGRGRSKRRLPRGIARNLERGKSLPPGIARQYLPPALVDRLPPAPEGFERVVLAGKVLLVEIATQAIHDVLSDVILDR